MSLMKVPACLIPKIVDRLVRSTMEALGHVTDSEGRVRIPPNKGKLR